MTVKDILSHFTRLHKVTIIEHNGCCLNLIYEGLVGPCLQEIPTCYENSICHDWKVINGMLNIWI